MKDFGRSDDPRVQAQLDRLAALSIPQGRLGLETIRELLDRLDNPQRHLPPTFHVAGTNGKGSVCAFLRAMLEAQGYTVHVAASPHLVRYNERIRIAGKLVDDEQLAELLKEVLDAGENLAPSFFEITIAASFLAFSRAPADACVVEVGLGGRFDATNVFEKTAVCGIAALGIDHEAFLLVPEEGTPTEPIARIAFEKAGIARQGVPLVTMSYPAPATEQIRTAAARAGAPLYMAEHDWFVQARDRIEYHDSHGELSLPLPSLRGTHQAQNAALAVAMLRHQTACNVSAEAMAEGIRTARWPARLQLLGDGPLTALAPDRDIWLDGGHNADAGQAIARHFADDSALHLIIGMLDNRAPQAIIGPLGKRIRSLTIVPVPGHDSHPVEAFGPDAIAATDIEEALTMLPDNRLPVLIAGSLYLAGAVLTKNGQIPD